MRENFGSLNRNKVFPNTLTKLCITGIVPGVDKAFTNFFRRPLKSTANVERKPMTDRTNTATCSDDTQQFTLHLPCRLAERAEKYAKENGYSITGVVIEALDTFLRGQKLD